MATDALMTDAPLFASREDAVRQAIGIILVEDSLPRLSLILCALGASELASELMTLNARILGVVNAANTPRRRRRKSKTS